MLSAWDPLFSSSISDYLSVAEPPVPAPSRCLGCPVPIVIILDNSADWLSKSTVKRELDVAVCTGIENLFWLATAVGVVLK